jgi:hypothetical protein
MNGRFSRRDFLKLAEASATYVLGASAFGGIVLEAAKYGWQLPVGQAEVAWFEDKFGVKIYSPAFPVRIIDDTVRQDLGIRAQNGLISKGLQTLIGWNFAELSVADATLEQLPPHLYESESGEIMLGIGEYKALTSSGEGGFRGGACVCSSDNKVYDFLEEELLVDPSPPVIVYSERDIFSGLLESCVHPKMVIVHESVHMYQNTFDDGGENPLAREALKICGADSRIDLHKPCSSLAEMFSNDCAQGKDPGGEGLSAACKEKERLGIIGQSPEELIPVASELYFVGKEELCASFALKIGDERASRLCQFIKGEVFAGKEYHACFSLN